MDLTKNMDLKEVVAKYCNYQQEMHQKLSILNARNSRIKMQLAQCEMEKSQICQTILQNKATMDKVKAAVAAGQIVYFDFNLVAFICVSSLVQPFGHFGTYMAVLSDTTKRRHIFSPKLY